MVTDSWLEHDACLVLCSSETDSTQLSYARHSKKYATQFHISKTGPPTRWAPATSAHSLFVFLDEDLMLVPPGHRVNGRRRCGEKLQIRQVVDSGQSPLCHDVLRAALVVVGDLLQIGNGLGLRKTVPLGIRAPGQFEGGVEARVLFGEQLMLLEQLLLFGRVVLVRSRHVLADVLAERREIHADLQQECDHKGNERGRHSADSLFVVHKNLLFLGVTPERSLQRST